MLNTAPPSVYFLQPAHDAAGPIKIGCSVLPASRLQTFTAWSPYPLVLLASAPGGRTHERLLHRRFAASRTHSEWFSAAPDLLALIRGVQSTGELPFTVGSYKRPRTAGGGFMIGSRLPEVMAQLQLSTETVAELLGTTVGAVRQARSSGLADTHIGPFIAFAESRGLRLTPEDLFFDRKWPKTSEAA